MTGLYAALHFLVDGLCALAMFGKFIPEEGGYFYILLYNFCAFALQMPLGVLLDALNHLYGKRRRRGNGGRGKPDYAFLTAGTGVLCTILGGVTHPVILGIGNALFHVGGGVGTIREDHAANRRGAWLGVFVAPGALGLYLGNLIAAGSRAGRYGWSLWFSGVSIFMLFLLWVGKLRLQGHPFILKEDVQKQPGSGHGNEGMSRLQPERACGDNPVSEPENVCRRYQVQPRTESMYRKSMCGKNPAQPQPVWRNVRLAICSLLVVILRSYIGMAVGFPWKTGVLAGLLSVLALVGGKIAGGFLAAGAGASRTAVISLVMAALCYLFSSWMPAGLAALFLFNMTMPITLYWVVCAFPQMPGFAFGFLTFALFLGFLPGYFELQPLWNGNGIGCAGSVLSLLLLTAGTGKGGRGEKLSG